MGANSTDFGAGADVFSRRSHLLASRYSRDRLKTRALYALLFVLLVARWFTETLRLLPRAFNFADLALLGSAIAVLFSGNYWRVARCRFWCTRLSWLVAAFLSVALLSTAVNLVFYNISIAPAVLSVAFYLEPIVFALTFLALEWDDEDTRRLTNLVVLLGVLQIPAAILQFPQAIVQSDPDAVSGTFGMDNSQMCFFIVLVVSFMGGRYILERRKIYLLPLPALVGIFYAAGFKALWYALPPTVALVVLTAVPLRLRHKLWFLVATTIIMLGVGLQLGRVTSRTTTSFLKKGYIEDVVNSGALWQIGKIQTFTNIPRLYREVPLATFLGVGPGSYSDRAFFTFTQVSPDPTADTNVAHGFISPSDPGRFANEYYVPLVYKSSYLFGSWTIDGPTTSYVSLLAEVGLIGFVLYMLIYFRLYKLALATARRAWARRDAQLFGLSIACAIGLLLLLEMAFLDNWLEVSRVTVPLWLLFVPLLQSTSISPSQLQAINEHKTNGEDSGQDEPGGAKA
jgi:hypothetical protein